MAVVVLNEQEKGVVPLVQAVLQVEPELGLYS